VTGSRPTAATIEALDTLAAALSGPKFDAALRWVASGCAIRGLVRDIDRAATRVHDLVTAVKGFTYMGHATVPEPVDLGQGLTDTLRVVASKARSRSASLKVDLPDDLPRVRGFGGELNQVWVNLIDNALDAAGESGRVTVQARAEAGKVVVRITDNGPGIPDDLKRRVFDPFFTTKPVGQGTGLGLDIVRRLVERNDGLIDLESTPGRTEFRVTLPVA
jgi:signal transduction histidine kinase